MEKLRYVGLHFDAASIGLASAEGPTGPIEHLPVGDVPPSVFREPLMDAWIAADGVAAQPHSTTLLGVSPLDQEGDAAAESLPAGRYDMSTVWRAVGGEPSTERRSILERASASQAVEALASRVQQRLQSDQVEAEAGALVIPNWFDEVAQDAVLESLTRVVGFGDKVRLVWRPIAAAMTWCDRFGPGLLREDRRLPLDVSMGSLLSLHLGIDEFEAVRLQLVPNASGGGLVLLPARDRVDAGPTAQLRRQSRGHAHALLRLLAASSFAGSGPAGNGTEVGPSVSRIALLSPWLRELLWTEDGAARSIDPVVRLRMTLASGGVLPVSPWPPRREKLSEVAQQWMQSMSGWLTEATSLLGKSSRPWVGAVVSGPLASVPYGTSTLGERIATSLAPTSSPRVLVANVFSSGGDVAAHGAARFAARAKLDLPTYLDTLPELKMLTSVLGEPEWSDLLPAKAGGEANYVPGAREWERQPDLAGFSIEKDGQRINFHLQLGGHPTVKRSTTSFPKPVPARLPIVLNIRMRPAAGFARIQIRSDGNEPVLGSRPILLDFRHMEDTGKSPTQIQEEQERSFPKPDPRPASPTRWKEARRLVDPGVRTDLGALRDALQAKDNESGMGATAISSDCRLPTGFESDTKALNSIVNKAMFALSRSSDRADAMAVLGYASAERPELETQLLGLLQLRDDQQLEMHEWIAVGGCLRDPTAIAMAISRVERHLSAGLAPMHPLRALAQLLRYREDALRNTESEVCERLAKELVDILEYQLDSAMRRSASINERIVLAFIFREALRSFFFLLRRRRYDDSFLDPQGKTARDAIGLLNKAKDATRQRRVAYIGGAVNVDGIWDGITDHIDKRGTIPVEFADG
jgi:hypothetical protein